MTDEERTRLLLELQADVTATALMVRTLVQVMAQMPAIRQQLLATLQQGVDTTNTISDRSPDLAAIGRSERLQIRLLEWQQLLEPPEAGGGR
jgi:hypothetical protein